MAYMRCLEIVSGFPANLTITIISITVINNYRNCFQTFWKKTLCLVETQISLTLRESSQSRRS